MQAEHQVHILDSLPGCPLDQVVQATDNDKPPCPAVNGGVNEAQITPSGIAALVPPVLRGCFFGRLVVKLTSAVLSFSVVKYTRSDVVSPADLSGSTFATK